MAEGWVKLHRQIRENELWKKESFSRAQAWLDLILLANHKEGSFYVRGNLVVVPRGFVGWSKEALAKEWKWSRNKLNRYLQDLSEMGKIAQQKSHILGLIEIINYDKYQGNDTTEGTTEKHQKVQQKGNKQEEYKNEKNDKENESKDSSQYGNKEINDLLEFLKKILQVGDLKESQAQQRIAAKNLLRLMDKITREKFKERLEAILADDFKRRNSSSLWYLYREIKGFVSSQKQNKIEAVPGGFTI